MADHQNGNGQAANVKDPGASMAYPIDLDNFGKRLRALYSHWDEQKINLWGSSDVLAIATPPASEYLHYLKMKSSALNIWLLGYKFPKTIMVFARKHIHFLCSEEKAYLLEVVRRPAKEAVGVDVVIHVKARSDDGSGLMDVIFRALLHPSKDAPVIGLVVEEVPEGKLLETWVEKLKCSDFQISDVTNGLSDLFAVKDSGELTNMKKSAFMSASVMKTYVVPTLENVIEGEKEVTHSSLMGAAEKVMLVNARAKVGLKPKDVGVCFRPIFQSGGKYDLEPSAASNDEHLYYDSGSVIICALGSRCNSYCCIVARTFLIDVNLMQRKAYEVLLKAHEAAIGALKPGNKISVVYQAALSVVEMDAPELVANLTKTAGTGIGLEFQESGLSLNAKNDRLLKAGMAFNVSLGFQNLQTQTSNPKSQNISLLLADTVIVGEKPQVLTSMSSKAVEDVAYLFNEYGEEEETTVNVEAKGKVLLSSKATRKKLILAGNKFNEPIKLKGLWIRPFSVGRGSSNVQGTLEAHVNGFRYSALGKYRCVYIMYDNIKHAFFQPAEREMITLLHFHLHNPIMAGYKKTKDVQFYVRVMDVSQTLRGDCESNETEVSDHDSDETEVVQSERDRENKINMNFLSFVSRVNDIWRQPLFKRLNLVFDKRPLKELDLEFERPFMDLGFRGVPYNASAFIVPTSSCLVELIEPSFLVITLSEIEIVYFERVGIGEENFDITIVFKDLKKDVMRIDSIPSQSLDAIKEWLDMTDIKYYETKLYLNWRPMVKMIIDDPQRFVEDGGWECLPKRAKLWW